MAIVGFFTAVLLVPLVLFYFLRDWHEIVGRIDALVPRRFHRGTVEICGEIDRVLGEFLRGQISVMLIMSACYATALWVAGLEYALPIGILSGLLVLLLIWRAGRNSSGTSRVSIVRGHTGLAGVAAFIGQLLEGMVAAALPVSQRSACTRWR
jgi:hypothetical protein